MVDRFMRREAVELAVGLRRSTIYEKMQRGEFPKPVRIGSGRAVAWLESEIAAYQKQLIALRDNGEQVRSTNCRAA